MECTDIVADRWMGRVISPALGTSIFVTPTYTQSPPPPSSPSNSLRRRIELTINHVVAHTADGGVSRPLESLQRMADIDWESEGVCKSCADEMREEWAQERGRVWRGEGRWGEWVSEIEDREREA